MTFQPIITYTCLMDDKAGPSQDHMPCHKLPQKWTDLVVMTMLSAYISHGQELEYCCSTDSHAVKCSIVLLYHMPWT
jgi:hypothetical protein